MGNSCSMSEMLDGGIGKSNTSENFKRIVFDKVLLQKNALSTRDSSISINKKKLELTPKQKILIEKYWESVIMVQRKDLFHKTMLASIESSPKINEIIACGKYCYRDLTQWPKLNRICQAQFNFFHHLIVVSHLDDEEIVRESYRIGKMHSTYAQFGLKAHFLDIFQLYLLKFLNKLKIESEEEKWEMLSGWTSLMDFMIECINVSYSQAVYEIRNNGKLNSSTMEEL